MSPGDPNHCQRRPDDKVVPLNREHADEVEGQEDEHWLGPVADTVLVDFLFYGLFLAVPVLMLWIFFGRWWIFQNFHWVALGVGIWFVLVLGWRRKRGQQ